MHRRGDRACRRGAGLRVELRPQEEGSPEALAAELARAGELAGARVLFPRAARAREALGQELARRGARVDAPEAYQTRAPRDAGPALRSALADGIDAVALTSPSTVEHLFALLEPDEAARLCARARFACIGATTAEALRAARPELRFSVAERPSMAALVAALERAHAEEPDGLS